MKTVLITGANRGLGLEFAAQYAAEGWKVIACCRVPEKADALKKISGIQIEGLDVGDEKSIKTLGARLKDIAIDLLINNAGIYTGGEGSLGNDLSQTFGTLDVNAWTKVFLVNTIAPILMIETFMLQLKKGSDKKIVNITSRMGSLAEMEGKSGSIAYRSSKTALNSAMRAIANELHAAGLSVFNFHPGWVQTDMGGKGADLTIKESVAAMRQTIAKLTSKNNGQYINYDGQSIPW